MIEEGGLHKPAPAGPACERCMFWQTDSTVTGKCRRMPPAAHWENGHYWPIVGRSDWCGEFKLREGEKA